MQILAIDVGMGTQDILLYDSKLRIENCVKMVLPSRTNIVAKKIMAATKKRRDIVLLGRVMGGGPCSSAVKKHIAAGLRVYSTEEAAKTLHDNLERVIELGVRMIGEEEARGMEAIKIEMKDLDLYSLEEAFALFGLDLPRNFAVAVQDHGYAPEKSNRVFRFEYFRKILEDGGELDMFAYKDSIPSHLTRMQSVKNSLLGKDVLLMDTGPAAIRGALLDRKVADPSIVLNIGNGHTLGAVVSEEKILGLFEHHTFKVDCAKLEDYIRRLADGTLTFSEVYQDGGHGCYIREALGFENVETILVTGPNRDILRNSKLELVFAAPFGDMMLTGCFGLVDAYLGLEKKSLASRLPMGLC